MQVCRYSLKSLPPFRDLENSENKLKRQATTSGYKCKINVGYHMYLQNRFYLVKCSLSPRRVRDRGKMTSHVLTPTLFADTSVKKIISIFNPFFMGQMLGSVYISVW